MMKLLIFWGSWLCLPLAALRLWAPLRGRPAVKVVAALALAITGVLACARFAEPRQLVTHRGTFVWPGAGESPSPIRITLPADPHTGVFGNALPVGGIAARINAEDVDAVFLAGDLTYHPGLADIPEDFAALGNLDAPLFAVPGNHDAGRPGSDLTDPLRAALGEAGATIIHNRAAGTDIAGHGVVIAGASDLWQRRQDFAFSSCLTAGKPVILLTHNPDTALRVPDDFACDLMPAGPTHGGQVRIPGLYQKILPATGPFDRELHPLASPAGERLVYVTTGTGIAGALLRFLMPPRVDILTIHLPANCRPTAGMKKPRR